MHQPPEATTSESSEEEIRNASGPRKHLHQLPVCFDLRQNDRRWYWRVRKEGTGGVGWDGRPRRFYWRYTGFFGEDKEIVGTKKIKKKQKQNRKIKFSFILDHSGDFGCGFGDLHASEAGRALRASVQ